MKKISTLFKKDPKNLALITEELNPENKWVMEGKAIATRKFDGTAAAIFDGKLFKRYDVKKDRIIPDGAIACQEPDPISGHHPHWLKCERDNPSDKYFFEAFDMLENKEDGTYELCGEKCQGNPEKLVGHQLIKHGAVVIDIKDFSFASLKEFLVDPTNDIEGIVFHHVNDVHMCKLRKSDFGIKRAK